MTDFKHFYSNLSKDDRQAFAERAGTTVDYIECHLLAARKVPRPKLMNALANASEGKITLADLALFFNRERTAA